MKMKYKYVHARIEKNGIFSMILVLDSLQVVQLEQVKVVTNMYLHQLIPFLLGNTF